ncbi:metallophosphatase family protein [Solirubrobacter sp. CPCC 204708]|uniref:Metallophosphatase family protein n=1 Tax=Solirubrobacter deserti TaxID=2282478 RepID=A0ABT4RPD4_9ACTN|nr:metallophosphoesterase family protein [Solirubrobacter deserti]MBE2319985.1 metallophosphatase family protein [Solirubrobacter deserti]MDA0140418.1 metallophosphatase family protein [Solirubrobacter deserti]
MQVAICTDIHGNRHAFEAVIAAAQAAGAEAMWCLGDLVGYGAEPDACVALAREHCSIVLAGNHDLAVTGALSLEDFSKGAALAAQWTQRTISEETMAWLSELEPADESHGYGLFHASPRDPVWEYVLSPHTAEGCFRATDFPVSFVGHSHVALSFSWLEGEPVSGTARRDGTELDLSVGRWLINPGGTGQPRDGDPRAAWLLLDTEDARASYRRAEYDIAGAQAAIRATELPASLADRLQYGQ